MSVRCPILSHFYVFLVVSDGTDTPIILILLVVH